MRTRHINVEYVIEERDGVFEVVAIGIFTRERVAAVFTGSTREHCERWLREHKPIGVIAVRA